MRKTKRMKDQEYYNHYMKQLASNNFKISLERFIRTYQRSNMFWRCAFAAVVALYFSTVIIMSYGV